MFDGARATYKDFSNEITNIETLDFYVYTLDFVRVYAWLTWEDILDYFRENYWVASTMANGALCQRTNGKHMYLVQLSLY